MQDLQNPRHKTQTRNPARCASISEYLTDACRTVGLLAPRSADVPLQLAAQRRTTWIVYSQRVLHSGGAMAQLRCYCGCRNRAWIEYPLEGVRRSPRMAAFDQSFKNDVWRRHTHTHTHTHTYTYIYIYIYTEGAKKWIHILIDVMNKFNESKFYCGRDYEQIEVRKCLLSFGAESFVFQVAIQKFKDQDI